MLPFAVGGGIMLLIQRLGNEGPRLGLPIGAF